MDDKTLAEWIRNQDLNREGPGEALLLARAPVFKVRYTWDGDLALGCTIGCVFCYYRWVPMSRAYIGTGALRPLASPDEMTAFLLDSRLFDENSLLILGARGDASMYPDDLLRFLEVFPGPNLILALHRPAADVHILHAFEDPRFRFGTTITPGAYERGWTSVVEGAQLSGLAWLVEQGVDPDRISIEVGPLTADTLPLGEAVLRRLRGIGFRHACVRGVSFGALGSTEEEAQAERKKLRRRGFLDGNIPAGAGAEGHKYYDVKNALPPDAPDHLAEVAAPMRLHRRTYTLYRDVWGVAVARNRSNRVRIPATPRMTPEEVEAILSDYGLRGTVTIAGDHYFVNLTDGQVATEDLAMTIGTRLDAAIIFDRYRRTAALSDIWFYHQHSLLAFWPFLDREVQEALREIQE